MANAKDDLEAFAAKAPAGPAKELMDRLLADPYEAARLALRLAIQLGADAYWKSGDDYMEWFADKIGDTGTFRHPGSPENLEMYRQLADAAGISYTHGDEEEEE
jgi:hypothetical protein